MADSLFTKILKKEIPGEIVYEDDICFSIKDINPQAPIHLLIIPKKQIEKVSDAHQEDLMILGHLMYVSKTIADKLVVNNGAEAGQSVFHIHIHLLGGRDLKWPPG